MTLLEILHPIYEGHTPPSDGRLFAFILKNQKSFKMENPLLVDPAAVLSRIDPAFNVITFLEQPSDWSYRIEKVDDPRVDLMYNDV